MTSDGARFVMKDGTQIVIDKIISITINGITIPWEDFSPEDFKEESELINKEKTKETRAQRRAREWFEEKRRKKNDIVETVG